MVPTIENYETLRRAMKRELATRQTEVERKQRCLRKSVAVVLGKVTYPGPGSIGFEAVTGAGNGPSSNNPCSGEVGKCGCSHAEPRAILQALRLGFGFGPTIFRLIMLSKYSPCTNCANIICDSHVVKAVVYDILTEHDTRGVDILKLGGIEVVQFKDLTDDRLAEWR